MFVFAGLLFSRRFYYTDSVLTSIFTFLIFCILSSGIYILNDIVDYKKDRMHPIKSQRPIAAGTVKKKYAFIISLFLVFSALLGAYYVNYALLYTCLIYCVMMISYTLLIKQIVILDVLFVAVGYVLRAIAGAVAIQVEISSWLLLCTLLLALFIVLSKRRAELMLFSGGAEKHRKVLSQYTIPFLNQMIGIVTAACIVSYCLYTLSPETVSKFNTRNLIFTVPFVIYGIFRYLYLIHGKYEDGIPEKIVLKDIPLQSCLVLWVLACFLILHNT